MLIQMGIEEVRICDEDFLTENRIWGGEWRPGVCKQTLREAQTECNERIAFLLPLHVF